MLAQSTNAPENPHGEISNNKQTEPLPLKSEQTVSSESQKKSSWEKLQKMAKTSPRLALLALRLIATSPADDIAIPILSAFQDKQGGAGVEVIHKKEEEKPPLFTDTRQSAGSGSDPTPKA